MGDVTERESFYAIRRVDGELIDGYGWVSADGPNAWEWVEESDGEPTEYEMVRMWVEPIERRTIPDPIAVHEHVGDECWYCGEEWPCEWIRDLTTLASLRSRRHG